MKSSLLNDSRVSRVIELALMEDIGLGDLTSDAIIPDAQLGRAELLCKEDGVIAGLEVAALVFEICDHSVSVVPIIHDGEPARSGQTVARIDGGTRSILKGERTALNFLQRMSGIATMTRRFVDAVAGTNAKVVDTRKTVPGLRVLDKWAVRLGGGTNHRFGLDDMVLIKDNHIVAAGGITQAVDACRKYLSEEELSVKIEVETKDLTEVQEAIRCQGIHRIMLDNFEFEDMRTAVAMIRQKEGAQVDNKIEVEASGGVTLQTVRAIAETGVDFISVGALTHSVKGLDISLELLHV